MSAMITGDLLQLFDAHESDINAALDITLEALDTAQFSGQAVVFNTGVVLSCALGTAQLLVIAYLAARRRNNRDPLLAIAAVMFGSGKKVSPETATRGDRAMPSIVSQTVDSIWSPPNMSVVLVLVAAIVVAVVNMQQLGKVLVLGASSAEEQDFLDLLRDLHQPRACPVQ